MLKIIELKDKLASECMWLGKVTLFYNHFASIQLYFYNLRHLLHMYNSLCTNTLLLHCTDRTKIYTLQQSYTAKLGYFSITLFFVIYFLHWWTETVRFSSWKFLELKSIWIFIDYWPWNKWSCGYENAGDKWGIKWNWKKNIDRTCAGWAGMHQGIQTYFAWDPSK